ncbi:MAG: cytochrome c oxidase subunit II [Gemmatimonadetes bacterium]|uniref:Cytochrome c oxidase subunit 2 n=1 Tax=Candidatus Kutchimonas denitrificans TaxID=3056748 RepID=A0AAE5CDQ4_9BACT|nr:cytochrome c oxidase subunit II [Gemmatimonadota bacterium]NIR76259.1 cytochrome c oxidase subunit II [Candidatus Kutchimonas denitrificans]NIS02282.1 cytochrome c oxidase subunit II [Gemmatimonadota bacterium]NIT68101.1 cytochrome c oxidase subunit II [Gemmatimonadota bacterium]NIU54325.1 cytochrome c oxidase subunit II [Gemmatimonadota bacterium]
MDWLPAAASTYAADIDRIFYVILAVTGVILVGVLTVLIYFLFRYRGREGRKAFYIEGSNRAEVIWTVIPALFILGLAFASQSVWPKIKSPDRFPTDALELHVRAEQFEWNVTYPGADGSLGTDDDFTTRNQVHVPVDRPVVLHMESIDVIHSFFVPAFRIKQDVVPGMQNDAWFQATETGEFELACAELCGLGHYRMRARVIVHAQDEYESWMVEQS